MAHTPGPWTVSDTWAMRKQKTILATDYPIAFMDEVYNASNLDDNARLIAAAPDLLALAEELVADGVVLGFMGRVQAAIKQAKGEA